MSLAHCRDLLASADPDRLLATLPGPPDALARLIPLYALNVEISRAAWASSQPLVAEMRLQWWRDVLEELGQGAPPRSGHPVLEACGFLSGDAPAIAVLDTLVEARRWDIWSEPFADEAALWAHLDATGGGLMWLAARALGAPDSTEAAIRLYAAGSALASWLRAAPELMARGRHPLPDASPQGIAQLAKAGLARITSARARRNAVPATARPALLPGWQAAPLLRLAASEPDRVLGATLHLSEFARRGRLVWAATTGRW